MRRRRLPVILHLLSRVPEQVRSLPSLACSGDLSSHRFVGALVNLAGVGGLLVFYTTQVVTVFAKREVTGLSLPAFIFLFIGCVGLMGTSLKAHSRVLEAVNLVGAVCTGATIAAIIAWQ